eukprot:scaffold263477_cov18-Tisochrysis_lutea.AAC.1
MEMRQRISAWSLCMYDMQQLSVIHGPSITIHGKEPSLFMERAKTVVPLWHQVPPPPSLP